MSSEYKETTESVLIPPHAGVEGFLVALRGVLKLSRVTQVVIESTGNVRYTRYVRSGEPRKNIEVDFDSVAPSALVRNLDLQEVDIDALSTNAAAAIAAMFYAAAIDHMVPIAFVTGANSMIYEWHRTTTGVRLVGDTAYGLPVHRDRFLPDEALLLVTAFTREASLVDCQKSYKISMPSWKETHPAAEFDIQPQVFFGDGESTALVAAEVPKDDEVKVIL